jgi:superfamily I DNA/RNA helicase
VSSATADDGHFVLPAGLTSPQREAVTDPGPLLSVLAGAGAGKTRVLTLRVARRVHDASAEPEHVLVATFSRKAATELRRRLYGLEVGGIEAGTFHRIALSLILRQRADRRAAPPTVLAPGCSAATARSPGARPLVPVRRRHLVRVNRA